jgi:hypothetical protein
MLQVADAKIKMLQNFTDFIEGALFRTCLLTGYLGGFFNELVKVRHPQIVQKEWLHIRGLNCGKLLVFLDLRFLFRDTRECIL